MEHTAVTAVTTKPPAKPPTDPTIAAIPAFFGTIGAEAAWLKSHPTYPDGRPRAGYERRDTVTSLTMGTLNLIIPPLMPKLVRPVVPGVGRWGKVLVGVAAGAVVATTVADRIVKATADDADADASAGADRIVDPDEPRARRWRRAARRAARRWAPKVAAAGGVTAVLTGGLAAATSWTYFTSAKVLWERRLVKDLGSGPLPFWLAMLGWDFVYYWNHRLQHTSRAMWAIHVVHHSSEHYNLSTALRQPVADVLGIFAPYGVLSLFGIRPSLVTQARAWNLLYQYWVHTETIPKLGPFEKVFNTASLHRVHHGSNKIYLDRNHAGILIIWDRMFGTHQLELDDEPVVYGLTKNIDTFNPARVATHEHTAILRDVAAATDWRTRLSHVVRGPGWSPDGVDTRTGEPTAG